MALRDLARYQARSGAALAAITLALGIAAAVVVTAAAEEKQENERTAAALPNLSDRQIRVYTGRRRETRSSSPSRSRRLPSSTRSAARVRQLAAGLESGSRDPAVRSPSTPAIRPSSRSRATGPSSLSASRGRSSPRSFNLASGLYVATPALLRHLGIDPATVDPSTDFLADPTVPTDELVILSLGTRKKLAVTNVQRIDSREVLGAAEGDTGRVPSSFVTLGGLRRHGWKQTSAGWLVESSRPLTSEQIAAARELAAEAGLTIEVQRESTSFAKPIAIATAAGALLALAILAMTVGLIRSESAGDLRTLTATGATNRIRRTLTAATAGALALLGALLGVAGAYLALAATYLDDLGYLSGIPLLSLVLDRRGRPSGGHRRRLAPRRPRAARHRPARDRVTRLIEE